MFSMSSLCAELEQKIALKIQGGIGRDWLPPGLIGGGSVHVLTSMPFGAQVEYMWEHG